MSQSHLKKVPAVVGPYRHAVEAGGWVFVSGQIPVNPETGVVVTDDVREATRQALANLTAVLEESGLTLKNVVKTTVYVINLADFACVNQVYAEFFTEPCPARACVQVAALPKSVPVEIEAIAFRTER
ncbi:MAG: Rid family detoxifying hydrolase [Kiritimatiellia bacterium]